MCVYVKVYMVGNCLAVSGSNSASQSPSQEIVCFSFSGDCVLSTRSYPYLCAPKMVKKGPAAAKSGARVSAAELRVLARKDSTKEGYKTDTKKLQQQTVVNWLKTNISKAEKDSEWAKDLQATKKAYDEIGNPLVRDQFMEMFLGKRKLGD